MKTCKVCKETKPLAEFQKRAINKDGHTTMCKPCKRKYDNTHYKNNPYRKNYIRENSDRRIRIVRDWVLEYLQNHPCVDCGERDVVVLEFDHQRDKVMEVGSLMKTGTLERVQAEVAKCEVRCCNCHRRKTARDFGSWRTSQ